MIKCLIIQMLKPDSKEKGVTGMRRVIQRTIITLGMTVALISMSGCLLSIRFQSFSKQPTLPEKLSLADEDSWSDEPVSVDASEASTVTSISESAEEEIEQEAESAEKTEMASNVQESNEENVETESTETENTEGTTADSFVIPMPPLAQ